MIINALEPAHWVDDVAHVENAAGNPLFKSVQLEWSQPTLWSCDMTQPKFATDEPFLYALVRNHGHVSDEDRIVYIGLTRVPKARFGNHKKAKEIVARPGQTHFSYAPIEFVSEKNKIDGITYALEQLEHLMIWAIDDSHLENEKKMFTLPGMGANNGDAWHVRNTGYRFSGQMPQEIIYPWMLMHKERKAFER